MSAKKEKLRGSRKNIKTWDYVIKPGCDLAGTKGNNGRRNQLQKIGATDYNSCLAANLGITNLTASQLFSLAKIK
ncbi:hypothetical protein KAR91_47145 [Candidatus Pacearchaeota archaeon]|nr:hypothetical protein [Candidatus Pacearchaeota archaeon]